MTDEMISGACECGQVSFTSTQPHKIQAVCHCTDCRAATGEPFTQTAFFSSRALTFKGTLEEQKFVATSGAKTTRESCPECKSVIYDRSEGVPGLIGVVTRFISPPFKSDPDCHMWVRSKLPDTIIDDDLVKYDERIQIKTN